MESTFITIHDLSERATILFASASVAEVLGYGPEGLIGQPGLSFFHPQELPFAKNVHGNGIKLDKAAVLSYCHLRTASNEWQLCECVFTVVYDVLVAAISTYRASDKARGRAEAAPVVRKIFSQDWKDKRSSMLRHLSAKFEAPGEVKHEARCALILNRFTRSLTVLYSTGGLQEVVGISPQDLVGRSFWQCMSEASLDAAVVALERAKENDSIAYLRFTWHNPRAPRSDESPRSSTPELLPRTPSAEDVSEILTTHVNGRHPSGDSRNPTTPTMQPDVEEEQSVLEVEAVISCTSDGLLVVLRKARPLTTAFLSTPQGIYASPWSPSPLLPAPPMNALGGEYMDAIQQVAVFAWTINETNGDLVEEYGRNLCIDEMKDTMEWPGIEADAEEMI